MPENISDGGHSSHDKIEQRGEYKLYKTNHGHEVLSLNGKDWFAWIKTAQGAILVKSDSDHKEQSTLQSGKYLMVDIEDDPDFRDMPHLFLENNGKYEEVLLPNGLPTGKDEQKKVIKTDKTLAENEVEQHLKKAS